ncbi:MAG: AAA family ATPase [Planctomycetota bacterium]|nr:AAA family ATPase [Planctomycetota bacterium]MDA1247948.1 AAA family ATPase [Planctomycetota bacterium]
MYESHWGLSESPFASRPSTKWFHDSPVHDEALARLFYLIEQRRGFGLLSGTSGTGKTLTLRHLAEQIRRSQRRVASVNTLGMDGHELLWQLAVSLGLTPREDESRWNLWRRVTDHTKALQLARVQTVFLFDHLERADTTCHAMVERLFSSANSSGGLTTFIASVRSGDVAGLASFLSDLSDLRVELTSFQISETEDFIRSLLSKAGCRHEAFSNDAVIRIHAHSRGVPRLISRLCELSLITAMAEDSHEIDADLVDSVAEGLVSTLEQPAEPVAQHEYV